MGLSLFSKKYIFSKWHFSAIEVTYSGSNHDAFSVLRPTHCTCIRHTQCHWVKSLALLLARVRSRGRKETERRWFFWKYRQYTQKCTPLCPEKLQMPHPWRLSTSGWMEPWADWSNEWQPAHSMGWDWMDFKVPSSPSHSTVWWKMLKWH